MSFLLHLDNRRNKTIQQTQTFQTKERRRKNKQKTYMAGIEHSGF